MAMAIKKSLLALVFVAFFAGCSQSEQPARKECAMFEGFETNMTFGLNMADPFDVLLENGVGFDDATACRYGRTMLKMDVEETTLRSAYGFLPTQILIGETEHEIRQVEFVKQLGKVQSDMAHKAYDELCRRVDCSLTRSFDPGSIGGDEVERRIWMLKTGKTLCQYNVFLCRDDSGAWYIKVSVLGEMRGK